MKKVIIYMLVCTAVVFAANFCYVKTDLYYNDIIKCNAELIFKIDSCQAANNIMYLGESSNFTFSEADSSRKTISELISDFDTNYKTLTVSKGAIHAGSYKLFIKRLKETSTIKTVILTVNLRSFGINWIESDLETNLSRANILYENYPPLLKKILLSFKAYDNKESFKRKETITSHYKNDKFNLKTLPYKTVRDWDATVFNKGVLDANGNKDEEKTNIACHFIKNYAFVITNDNPRIKDLDEIVTFCRSKNIKLVFNLLPENYERAAELCGKDLELLMRENVLFIKTRYESSTVFIDNFSLLKDSCFIDRNWPTEHYIYFGRNAIAKKVHEQLQLFKINPL